MHMLASVYIIIIIIIIKIFIVYMKFWYVWTDTTKFELNIKSWDPLIISSH